jgi:hypothetical protein
MTSKREVSSRLHKVTSSQLEHAFATGDFKDASKELMVERASTSLACIVGHDLQVLTQKVHSTPITQQAEQSWLHTRREQMTCQSIFPEN